MPKARVIRDNYPIQEVTNPESNLTATVIVLPIPGGRGFVAATLEDPTLTVRAITQGDARKAAMKAYVQKHAPKPPHSPKRNNPEPVCEEDLRDLKIANRRMKERGGTSVEALAKKHGLRI